MSRQCVYFLLLTLTVLIASIRTVIANEPEPFDERSLLSSYRSGMAWIQTLDYSVARENERALLRFIERAPVAESISVEAVNAMKNDLVLRLLALNVAGKELGALLMAQAQSAETDLVWRDYSVQLLVNWSLHHEAEAADPAVRVLTRFAADPTHHLAGTALVSLYRLAQAKRIEIDEIAGMAWSLFSAPSSSESTRIAAFNIAAACRHPMVLEEARLQAATADSVIMRVAAIGTLATHGSSADLPFLRDAALSADARVRAAADSALKNLLQDSHVSPLNSNP